jgi:hypothetical protein
LFKTICKPLKTVSQGQELVPAAEVVSRCGRQAAEIFGDAAKMLRSCQRRFVVHSLYTFRPGL